MRLSVDLETECAVEGCPGGAYCRDEKHALIPHMNRITCIGVWGENVSTVYRGSNAGMAMYRALSDMGQLGGLELCFHEGRFDIKVLAYHGVPAEWLIENWADDTKLMAYVLTKKIPDTFLRQYEERRQELNKALPQGYSHRNAGLHSLKTLAPYFLDVEPFWEDPTNHDNDDYVLKDVRYTYELRDILEGELRAQPGQWEFYSGYVVEWVKELLRAEIAGIGIDTKRLEEKKAEAEGARSRASLQVEKQWTEYYDRYERLVRAREREKYDKMLQRAIDKLETVSPERLLKLRQKYHLLYTAKMAKLAKDGDLTLNLNSPKQLLWLLGELGLTAENFDGKPSTDKEVLERLAGMNPEVRALLEYRYWDKLCSTYYPSFEKYRAPDGRIHCNFNTSDTRTGRLSSSMPNLQNQPKETRDIFVSDPDTSFIIRDLSAIEPTLVAYFTGDARLCKALIEGDDFHGMTAKVIFQYITCHSSEVKAKYVRERNVAKTAGLAILYGSGARRLLHILQKEGFKQFTLRDCRAIVKRIRDYYYDVWKFKGRLDQKLENGNIAHNLLGRPIKFDSPGEVYMKGFNRLIQGSGSDIVLEAINRYNNWARKEKINSQMLVVVHDEILVQAPDWALEQCEDALHEAMTNFRLPTKYGDIKLKIEGQVSKVWVK